MKFALITAIALSIVMVFFALQNSQSTQVTFLGWYFDSSLVVILIMSFGAGIFATFLAMLPGSVRKSIEISRLKSQVLEYSSKLQKLEKAHSNDIPATTANYQQREELP
jgi:uncharacterized integral membrane protein